MVCVIFGTVLALIKDVHGSKNKNRLSNQSEKENINYGY